MCHARCSRIQCQLVPRETIGNCAKISMSDQWAGRAITIDGTPARLSGASLRRFILHHIAIGSFPNIASQASSRLSAASSRLRNGHPPGTSRYAPPAFGFCPIPIERYHLQI